jgi:hypothetical protein
MWMSWRVARLDRRRQRFAGAVSALRAEKKAEKRRQGRFVTVNEIASCFPETTYLCDKEM